MHSTPFIAQRAAGTWTGLWRNIAFSIWRETPLTAAEADESGRIFLDYAPRVPGGKLGIMVLLPDKLTPPSPEVRKVMERNAVSLGKLECCSSLVFRGSGFRAAIVRGVVTGLNQISRSPVEQRVFATSLEAADWMAPYLEKASGQPTRGFEIEAALQDVLAQMPRA